MVDRSSSPAAPFVAGAQSDQLRLPLRSSHERRGKEVKASGSGLSPQRQLPLQIYPCGDEFASDIATSSGMPLPSHLVGPLYMVPFLGCSGLWPMGMLEFCLFLKVDHSILPTFPHVPGYLPQSETISEMQVH